MALDISKPFDSYVTQQELPRTGDARKFETRLTYEIEGTGRTEYRRVEWRYSGTQEAVDRNAGVDGLKGRREGAVAQLRAAVEKELKEGGFRLYADGDRPMLIRGGAR
jgi:hypothetical protein